LKAIFGLGNPDNKYTMTRHNAGWLFLDFLKVKLSLPDFQEKTKFKAYISEGSLMGNKFMLIKPTTYMNLSGECVSAIKSFYSLDQKDIWVVYDDVDLPLGEFRIRDKGSPGTHNGAKSVVKVLGQEWNRVRIGIESRGDTAPKQQATDSFVLDNFLDQEFEKLKNSFQLILNHFMQNPNLLI